MKRALVVLTLLCSFALPAYADLKSAEDAYARGEYTAALREYKTLAEQGNTSAQTMLGAMYTQRGVHYNPFEAIKWTREAAKQGHAEAQSNLGAMYVEGSVYVQGGLLRQSNVEAVQWFRKAAEQGNASGQFNLGSMYAEGRGVSKDDVEAYHWANLAVASNDKRASDKARTLRDALAKSMTPAQIEQSQALTRAWVKSHGGR